MSVGCQVLIRAWMDVVPNNDGLDSSMPPWRLDTNSIMSRIGAGATRNVLEAAAFSSYVSQKTSNDEILYKIRPRLVFLIGRITHHQLSYI